MKKTGAAPSSGWSKYLDSDEFGLSSMPPAAPPPLPRYGSSVSSAANQVKYTLLLPFSWFGFDLAVNAVAQGSSDEMGVVNENDMSVLLDIQLTYDSSDEHNLEKYSDPRVFDLAEHTKKLLRNTREGRNEKIKDKKKRDYLREKEEKRKKWAVGTRPITDFFGAPN